MNEPGKKNYFGNINHECGGPRRVKKIPNSFTDP
jgi:hypothetical protein